MQTFDYAVIGGGIVGLATAWSLQRRSPKARLVVLEKEAEWAAHQTGRNSGVIHSGIYYRPGSLKARLSRAGSQSMVAFCREHGLAHEVCAKFIVAAEPMELPLLAKLFQRGQENGLDVRKADPAEVREHEPHVRCVEAIRVMSTGIVQYRQVCLKLVDLLRNGGAELRLESRVHSIAPSAGWTVLEATSGSVEAKCLVNCAGLHSDRVAWLGGLRSPVRIVPFRGEYYELKPDRRHLVRGLIYPVPNPDFPFLGVHFTRMIDGSVHAGPNAVLALKREGYHRTSFSLRDSLDTLLYPGFWRLAARNLGEGSKEMYRSFCKGAFVRSLQRLVPEVAAEDLVPGEAGVRAQALKPDGGLVDDFLILQGERAVHVLNAPSPAATASLEIGRLIVEQVPEV